jgi:F-type H+-transporting ATPase subunit b
MPQFDLANFVPQLAWLALFFAILYFGIVRMTLPKLGQVIDQREATVTGDIATAETAKAEADSIRAAYEADIAEAQARAQAAGADAKARAARDAEARLAVVAGELDARTSEAQAAIAAARGNALGEIERIAGDAASDIVERLTGIRPDAAAVNAAVAANRAA